MNKIETKTFLATALVVILALAGCAPKPRGEKQPAPDYQMPVAQLAPSSAKAICYDPDSMTAYHLRMLQQEMAVGTLTCTAPDGSRRFDKQYGDVLSKFSGDLSANAVQIKAVVAQKHINLDTLVTEFANREAQRRNDDPLFCARMERAFAWALSPQVTSMTQVPPPHDLGQEMNAFPCSK